MTVFIGNRMETEDRFLGTPSTKTEPAFDQGVVIFRLRPGRLCTAASRSAILSRYLC